MVSDVTDVRRARAVIEDERARLGAEGKDVGAVRVGAMIEVPSAVLVAEKLAREVDFFSLGTNDLVQYTLAVDRGNDEVAGLVPLAPPGGLDLHRARARSRRARAGIRSVVCGEMAASPAYAAMLLGLGARELSMAPTSIPRVRRTVAGLELEEAERVALRVSGMRDRRRGRGAGARAARRALAESFSAKKSCHPRKPKGRIDTRADGPSL